ncbi:MAG: hypothetical protein AAGA02_06285 [Bacteroidota bacterium]
MILRNIIYKLIVLFIPVLIWSCDDDSPTLALPVTPTNVTLNVDIAPDSSGMVTFTPAGSNVLTFQLFPGDGTGPEVIAPGESFEKIYGGLDSVSFTAILVAYGTGGASSSISTTIDLFLKPQVAPEVLIALTGAELNSSKRWVWDSGTGGINGHFGVGPGPNIADQPVGDYEIPAFFDAEANRFEDGCLYDDVLTFSVNSDGALLFNLETNGETFINEQAILDLVPGGNTDEATCNAVDDLLILSTIWTVRAVEGGRDLLIFGGGVLTPMSYYAAISEYEILELTPNKLRVRGFVPDETLAWYFQFIPE